MSGVQSTGSGATQVPVASHVDWGCRITIEVASQAAGAQTTPGVGWQLPSMFGTAHELHVVQLGDPQQKFSTQLPVMHSVPRTQDTPLGLRLVHEPPTQKSLGTQSVEASEQVVRQALLPPQAYWPQPGVMGVWLHEPLPLQLPTGVNVIPLHDWLPHAVDDGAN